MELTERQRDALTELINIGYARAAAALSDAAKDLRLRAAGGLAGPGRGVDPLRPAVRDPVPQHRRRDAPRRAPDLAHLCDRFLLA